MEDILNREMIKYGYIIVRVLITDIDPPQHVKESMNQVLESQNKRDAMINQAEAEKKTTILRAEAISEQRRLEGEGLAKQRAALADGLKATLENISGESHIDVNTLTPTILTMQYFDMLNNAATRGNNTFILNCNPSAVGDIESQMRNALLTTKGSDHANYGSISNYGINDNVKTTKSVKK